MSRPPYRRPAVALAAGALALALAGCSNALPSATGGPPTTGAPPRAVAPPSTAPSGSGSPGTTPATAPSGGSSPTTAPAARVHLPLLHGSHAGAALFHDAMADATARHWVRSVSVSPATAEAPATTITGHDGPGKGTQVVRIGRVSGDIRVIGDRTWIHGDAEALAVLFDVPTADAGSLGGHWVLLRSGDSDYTTVTAGVTLASLLAEVGFAGTVTAGTTTHDGRTTTTLEGRLPTADGGGEGVLYLTSGPHPLPLAWDQIGATGTTTLTFAAWGTASAVTPPPAPVPLPASGATEPAADLRPAGYRASSRVA